MDDEERLIQVANALPKDAALVLQDQPPAIQRMVVSQVVQMLDAWEGNGLTLDPVAYDFVIQAVVGSLVANAVVIETLKEKSVRPLPEA